MAMGIREWLNKQPAVVGAVSVVFVLIAGYFVVQSALPSDPTNAPTQAFFSDDDGATWFSAGIDNVPPFNHDGGEAVRAIVYECGGEEYVTYLERYKPDARQQVVAIFEEAESNGLNPSTVEIPQNLYLGGREAKRPGEGEWETITIGSDVVSPRCPHGASDHYPKVVKP